MGKTMKRTLSLKAMALLALICIGLQSGLSGAQQASQSASTTPGSSGFSVSVTLSDKARKLLTDQKETMIVAAYFSGFPKPGTPRKYVSDMGEIGLGQANVEIAPGAIAKFGPVKLKQDALNQVDTKGPQLLINVYSGRKSSPDNLLDCGIYEDALAPVQGKTIPISCKLIGE
jgi:hypothetical protein